MPPPLLTEPLPSLLSRILVKNLKYWPQSHPLCHCFLPLLNVCLQCLDSCFLEYLHRCHASPSPAPLPIGLLPVTCLRKSTCTPSSFLDITTNKTQVSAPKHNTACTTSQYNLADNRGSAPSILVSFTSRIYTQRAFLTFRQTSGQSSYDRSNIRNRYLKVSTPSIYSASFPPLRLKYASAHRLAIVASLLRHCI